jgi:Homing endonuclease associated repeat
MLSKVDKPEIIAELQRVARMLGTEQLSQSNYDELGTINRGTIRNRFGNWKDALVAAGLAHGISRKRHGSPSDDELLLEIIKVTSELDKIPSSHVMTAYGHFSQSPYVDRWGTFTEARKAAYLKYGLPIGIDLPQKNGSSVKASLTEQPNENSAARPPIRLLSLERPVEGKNFANGKSLQDSKQTLKQSNQGLAIDFKCQLIAAAKEASGQNIKFCLVIDKLPLDKSFPIDLAKELERELRGVLNCNDRDATLGLLIRKANDANAITDMGIDLAHTIRKQRNFVAHETTNQRSLQAQISLCLFAAALLWPEFS